MRNHQIIRQNAGVPMSVALLTAALALGTFGCKKAEVPQLPPPAVVVLDLVTTNVPIHSEIIGQLDSPENVQIRARVEGFVDKMLFVEGTNVSAGDPLFKLDDKPYQEKLKAAKGMLAEAQASLRKSETDVARLKPLADKKAVPQQDLDNALAAVEVGKASVVSAQANVDAAQLDVSYCDIRAPISGLIGAKQVSIGELVGKGEPTLMATISTLDPIWVYCNVSEVGLLDMAEYSRRTGKLLRDAPVTLILANGTEHPGKGKVVFVDRAVDTKTGTLRVRVEFANPSGVLRPGMFARMIVDFGTRPDSILVPQKAVTELQGKYFVWVIGAENKASQRPVVVARQIGEHFLIADGLKAGERIIVEGLQKARQDQPVKPMTVAEAAAAKAAQPAKEGETKHGKE